MTVLEEIRSFLNLVGDFIRVIINNQNLNSVMKEFAGQILLLLKK